MQCANCERTTPDSAVFCNHCGTRLVETCRKCGAHNPLGSRFCNVCGIELPEAQPENCGQEKSSPAEPPAREDPSTPNQPQEDSLPPTSVGHITGDLRELGQATKKLATDVVSYSTPRIMNFSKKVKTLTETSAVAAISHYKQVMGRLKSSAENRPAYNNPELSPQESPRESTGEVSVRAPIHCPRCRSVIEPDSRYCFSCGLPIDEQDAGPQPEGTHYGTVPDARYDGIPGGFWIRLAAWFIDLAVITLAELALIGLWPGFDIYFDENASYFHWVDLMAFVGIVCYYTFAVSVFQTTIGKRLLGLYVLRTNGSRVGPGRALARYFAGIFSWVLFGIGYLMIGLRNDKRGLHDLMCDTAVVIKHT